MVPLFYISVLLLCVSAVLLHLLIHLRLARAVLNCTSAVENSSQANWTELESPSAAAP